MSQNGEELVVHPDHQDPNAELHLAPEMDRNKKVLAELKLELAKKDAELRRTVEELSLHQQLEVVNQSTLRKLDHDSDRPNRMAISEENVARIVALEDEIKLESKRQKELQREQELLFGEQEKVNQDIENTSNMLIVADESTGYSKNKGRGDYVDPENRFREHQKILSALHDEQQTIKNQTAQHTDTIQDLSAQIEQLAQVEQDFEDAKMMLAAKRKELKEKKEDIDALHRISQKKEKMLKKIETTDDAKKLRQLEGDKRTLLADLQKQTELVRQKEKTVHADDLEIRRLETQLETTNAVLEDILDKTENAEREAHRPQNLEEGATAVPIQEFMQLVGDLDEQRVSMKDRERQMEELDAAIEANEKKVEILLLSQKSRDALAFQEYEDMGREKARIQDHVDRIQAEFETEERRLLAEQKRLKERLAQLEAEGN